MLKPGVTTFVPGQDDLIEEVIVSFPEKGSLLDIGTGSGEAAKRFSKAGWEVVATGFDIERYLSASSLPEDIKILQDVDICNASELEDASFDAVWCAHVLEHVSNTGLALEELRRILKPDGWLFIAVPPYKDKIVGGHVNTGWNLGSLMYVLADAGFDLKAGRFINHGYNVFGMVQRGAGRLPSGELHRANGDIEKLAKAGRFPVGFAAEQGFLGNQKSVNWLWNQPPRSIPALRRDMFDPPPLDSMKIGMFVPWITKSRGGTENVGQMMANAMALRGHHVTVFTFDDVVGPSRWPLEPTIELVHLPESGGLSEEMYLEVASRSFEVLVGLHMNRTMLDYTRGACKLGVPLVLSEHIDPRFPKWIGSFSPDERDIAMCGATLIHLLAEEFTDTLPASLHEKVRVIPNTVPEPENLAAPGGDKPVYTLLSVARLVPRKNQAILLEAFARIAGEFPDWQLKIVGDGTLRTAYEAQAKHLGIVDCVDFTGEKDEVYSSYADADLFVIPSLFEGFPLTLCEAIAHGLPSIGFRMCAGVRAQIEHEKTGLLCDSGDQVTMLAAALQRLMGDSRLRVRMGNAARKMFMERFGNAAVHTAWEEMFAEARDRGAPKIEPGYTHVMQVRLWEEVWGRITKNDIP